MIYSDVIVCQRKLQLTLRLEQVGYQNLSYGNMETA